MVWERSLAKKHKRATRGFQDHSDYAAAVMSPKELRMGKNRPTA